MRTAAELGRKATFGRFGPRAKGAKLDRLRQALDDSRHCGERSIMHAERYCESGARARLAQGRRLAAAADLKAVDARGQAHVLAEVAGEGALIAESARE